jgi:uncharacterized membrane protein
MDYLFEAEVTKLQTNITLIGENYDDLLIVNENGLPLEYMKRDNLLSVYNLGSILINLTYLTGEITGKSGIIWSLNTTVPISTKIILPVSSTIISLNSIPLEIDSLDERTVLIMSAGWIEIEYTIDILDSETLADEAIDLAEEAIEEAENNGAIVSAAKEIITEAKNLFQEGNFLLAEEKATMSIELVDIILNNMADAMAKINAAETAISIAYESGRTLGLDDAEAILFNAQTVFDSGDYEQASILAEESLEAALNSEKEENNTLLYTGGIILIILVGISYYTLTRPDSEQIPVEIEIDLEHLFNEHPELRMDDREVLKYLAENDGEAFAFDIRDRFDIPRTSAWRMIQRLQRYEVIDERKVGGQSLVSIKEKYRRRH